MNNQSFGHCRGCGRLIIWTRMKSGKNMPCDPEMMRFTPGGKDLFVTPDGMTARGTQSVFGIPGYISHWATCPEQEKFRRKADRKEKKE